MGTCSKPGRKRVRGPSRPKGEGLLLLQCHQPPQNDHSDPFLPRGELLAGGQPVRPATLSVPGLLLPTIRRDRSRGERPQGIGDRKVTAGEVLLSPILDANTQFVSCGLITEVTSKFINLLGRCNFGEEGCCRKDRPNRVDVLT